MSDLTLGRDGLGDLATAIHREWLVTNGIGGFASGTVSGALTLRYHGLLFAALAPPLARTLLLAKLVERLGPEGDRTELSTDLWGSGAVSPQGHRHLLSFRLEGAIPVWTWAVAGTRLEKRVWMEHGENTTCIEYALGDDGNPTTLSVRALVDHRDLHALTPAAQGTPTVTRAPHGLCVRMDEAAPPLWLAAEGAEAHPGGDWWRDFALPAERERGYDGLTHLFMAGEFIFRLAPGERALIVASTRPGAIAGPLATAAARPRRVAHERMLLDAWRRARPAAALAAPSWVKRLVLAADAFVVERASPGQPNGRTLLAGYPWLTEAGRDAMAALPGLAVATGRHDIARAVLRTWALAADRGRLPDRFPEAGGRPETHALDGSLWLFQAVRAFHAATGDDALLAELFPRLEDIGAWIERGVTPRLGVDPRDGLVRLGADAGAPLSRPLTWMDACVGGLPVTPRYGKPVEVNALWYNALTAMTRFARRLRRPYEAYAEMARRVRHGFGRYWDAEAGALHDVLDGPRGADSALRPNQILALSLPDSPLPAARRRAVLEACTAHLLVPGGLRSLAPDDPRYRGRGGGGEGERAAAAHQGTAWVWLLPHLALAHHRVHHDRAAALALLEPLGALLERHGVGALPECLDGSPPHAPRGAIAHAWAVGEALHAWHALAAAPARRAARAAPRALSAVEA